MKNFQTYKTLSFALLSVIFVAVIALAIITYILPGTSNMLLSFFVRYHIWLMLLLAVTGVAFGFFWSTISANELASMAQQSDVLLQIIKKFLSREEHAIIALVTEKGITTQAEVGRIKGMTRVKAHRTIQKLQERGLLEISSRGKVRELRLTQEIQELLKN